MHLKHPFFFYGIIGLAIVASSYPMWRPVEDEEASREEEQRSQTRAEQEQAANRVFRSRPTPSARVLLDPEGNSYSRKDLHAKFRRLRQLEKRGVREQLENSAEMDPDKLAEITQELDELDRLVELFPEVAKDILTPRKNPHIQEGGAYTNEFSKTIQVMQSTGEWTRMKDRNEESMFELMNDPEISPVEKPTEEELNQFQTSEGIPSF